MDIMNCLCYIISEKDGEYMNIRKKKNNSFKTSEVVFLVLLTCFVSFMMAYLILRNKNTTIKYNNDSSTYKLIEQYQNIVENYYGEIDKEKIISGAIKGMVEALDDPYATYFDETSANNFNIKLNGEFEGFGIEIIKYSNEYIQILSVFDNSPASAANIMSGDKIISINGKETKELTTTEFSDIVSESDSKINLVIERNGEKIDVSLSKGEVTLSSVSSDLIIENDKKIGYIKVSIFALNTYGQFRKELINLENNKIKGLIIDLRDNSGGHSISAENILSLFLSNEKVMYQIKNQSSTVKKYSNGDTNKEYPIAILVNKETASASEIVASSLSENLDATIIGTTTYGKGTAQNLIEMPSGEQYKYTTSIWLTANGNSINEKGINPDIEIADINEYMKEAIKVLTK